MEQIVLREALLAKIQLDSLKLNDAITEANQKNLVLEDEEKTFKGNLKACKK